MKTFLFVGCGSIGRRHIRNLKKLTPCRILAWRTRGDELGDFEKETGLETFRSYDDALAEKPDAVFITNPTSLHLPVALKAAEKGIPLFIEKPLSHTLDGIDEFIQICEKKKNLVLLGYKMRFHPSILKIKNLIDSGKLGKVISLRAHYGGALVDWHPWEDYRRMYSASKSLGGGVILDVIHEIDYVYWLMGDAVKVTAMSGKVSDLDIETEDLAEILMRFKNGAIGSVSMNYLERPEYRYCHVVGTSGTLHWSSEDKAVAFFDHAQKKWEKFPEPADFEANHMFLNEMKHFLACLEGKEKPIHNLQDAKRVLEIALIAKNFDEERTVR